MALFRLQRHTDYRPTLDDYAHTGDGQPLTLGKMPQESDLVMTPCPPRAHCQVCDGRLTAKLGTSADKTAKYRHQATEWGQMAARLMKQASSDAVSAAVRAAMYGRLALGEA